VRRPPGTGEGPGFTPVRERGGDRGTRLGSAISDWSVYILECADGSYYTGVTNALPRRLEAHAAGTASKYTRSRRPVRLVCVLGSWPTRGAALEHEARMKAMTRSQKRAVIQARGSEG
jgi:putative endonuclease